MLLENVNHELHLCRSLSHPSPSVVVAVRGMGGLRDGRCFRLFLSPTTAATIPFSSLAGTLYLPYGSSDLGLLAAGLGLPALTRNVTLLSALGEQGVNRRASPLPEGTRGRPPTKLVDPRGAVTVGR